MSKGLRLSEVWFTRAMWLIAIIFAGFLIGLGSLVVSDLPHVETPPNAEAFMNPTQLAQVRTDLAQKHAEQASVEEDLASAQSVYQSAQNDTQSARQSFRDWIATRTATQQSQQDPEVLRRTHELDLLQTKERAAERTVETLTRRDETITTTLHHDEAREQTMRDAAQGGYDAALRRSELQVFLLRLAVTLPLLLLSAYLFVKKRKSPYWPFVWGFIFFSLFSFFVELVPYLPSYGGYVRYIVGILCTVLLGVYAIRKLRVYLEKQKEEEAKPEQERRRDLGYDVALARLAKRACPGCERPFDTADTTANVCMHCGLLVFHNCPTCNVRGTVFSHFCRSCGRAQSQPATTL